MESKRMHFLVQGPNLSHPAPFGEGRLICGWMCIGLTHDACSVIDLLMTFEDSFTGGWTVWDPTKQRI